VKASIDHSWRYLDFGRASLGTLYIGFLGLGTTTNSHCGVNRIIGN
jgi:hypothetical protein